MPISKKRKTTKPKVESDDDVPLQARRPAKKPAAADSDSDDVPLGKKLSEEKARIEKRAEKQAKVEREKRKSAPKIKQASSDEDEIPLSKKKPAPKKSGSSTPAKAKDKASKKVAKKEEEEAAEDEEEEQRWWEATKPTGDGTKKWTTLIHNGVVFPPAYKPLPSNVKMRYEGKPVSLKPEAEEVATFFGSMLNSTHNTENPTFQKNFFHDFTAILDKTGHAVDAGGQKIKIKAFEKCDFRDIFGHFDAERQAKLALPAVEKKAIKAEKDQAEAPFQYCEWDGRKQKVGNFRVEPPGLFRGRGEHPKTGMVKQRVQPEQITINIGEDASVPAPPEGHRWKEIKHDHEGTWLAMWQENINGAYKYVMLAANSDIKGQSDFKKFEKARELKLHIDRIRKDYEQGLKAKEMATRQRATAMYLIDRFALRAGNEKSEDEADTVGCCSLKFEHVTLQPPKTVVFDFLGKDSIRFHEEFEVDEQVFRNLQIFKKAPKGVGDEIFDRLTTSALNKHLNSYMAGLTAKVFRTYNASWTMSELLKELVSTGSIPEKVKDYNEANRKVAILCNHKRTVAAGHAGQMEKLDDRIKGIQYKAWRYKQMLLEVDPKQKKKKGADWFALPEGIDQDWIQKHQAQQVEDKKAAIEKKFKRDNEKLVAEGQKEMKNKELEERLEAATELEKKYRKESKTKKVELEGKADAERLLNLVEKEEQRVETQRVQAEDKESNKEVALGTSKIVRGVLWLLSSGETRRLTCDNRTTLIPG